ncbi:GGDEF domain-containing response regulator [Roseibium sediminis]|uniref:GGDEF domain-containing response regulator n=1 Tax=Roseibium sediminis TaxID=1775174 RepID=UPI00123C8058|nr:diguanylate cyclase [Roseibium sediminis]
MQSILLVEDASFFEKAVLMTLRNIEECNVYVARSYKEAEELLKSPREKPDLALVDLTLPDARDGQIVDLTKTHEIPTIVFTSRWAAHIRKSVYSKGVMDYVVKDSPSSLDYLSELILQLRRNPETGVLVIDDSRPAREKIVNVLKQHRYQVFEASSAVEGQKVLEKNPQIKLLLLDYVMPGEDGFAFLKAIRRNYSRDDLAILGLSGVDDGENRVRFLKYGANDFIQKNCSSEEILLRVAQNLKMIDRITELRDRAIRDPLTGLYNRRFLFSQAEAHIKNAEAENRSYWVCLVDIDKFKSINDTYGHVAGDTALLTIARSLQALAGPSDFMLRLGGDEFCALLSCESKDQAALKMQTFLDKLRLTGVKLEQGNINVTASVGIAHVENGDITGALDMADMCLYRAKDGGRDKLIAC